MAQQTRTLRVRLDRQLAIEVDKLLEARDVTLAEVVSLYLRSMINSADSGRTLGLESRMPFGKYRGENVETIARGDPGYLRYLMGGERPLQFTPEVLELLK